MTRSPLWREFENGDNVLTKVLRIVVLVGGVAFLIFGGSLELTWPQQAVLGLLTILMGIWVDRSSSSYLVTLAMMILSCFATFRYGWWRVTTVIRFFMDPGVTWTGLDVFFICLLVLAECYAFAILGLGFMQTLWPLRRTPVPLPEDPDLWPEVDLLIPTYNEPLSVVKYTALASMNIDWPADKLNVYILDDGKREEMRAFAEEAGVGYMTRNDSKHAKAGNINRALERLHAPFVAIFDCDHVPTRSFLQITMGWFGRDPRLGMLQTPHHFYSPDPFERNLGQFRTIPNEGELFYGVVQDGNDFWNATFFCGSCAVLRREALDEVGGIAVETVTEDAHTSLRMQIRRWNTAYINIPQAAGLATERLSGHVKQRIRWARGMIQILRTDNPLFAKGLDPAQRLCYFNAMTHFLYALPRLIFLTAPLIYLVLGHTNVPGYWAAIFAYSFPHLVLSSMTNSRVQGQHRHSFWNEVYETVLAPYIFLPTMLALINPKLGSFNVTAKGGVVARSFFDTRIAQPFLTLIFLNIMGLVCAFPRYLHFPFVTGVPPFIAYFLNIPANMYDGDHPGTVVMNCLWTVFNLVLLGVATAVAWESRQRRQTVRVSMSVPAGIVLPDGQLIQGVTSDVSSGGVNLRAEQALNLKAGDSIRLVFPVLDGEATLPATVVGADGEILRAHFDPLTLQEEEALTMVLYSRADTWLGWGESREVDRPLVSLWRILQLSVIGFRQTAVGLFSGEALGRPPKKTKAGKKAKGQLAATAPVVIFLLLLLGLGALLPRTAAAQSASATPNQTYTAGGSGAPGSQGTLAPARTAAPGTFDNVFTLADFGVSDTITLRGVDAYHSVYFSLPQTELVKSATMKVIYHFSPGLLPNLSHLKVSLNGSMFADLPVGQQPSFVGTETNDLSPEQKIEAHDLRNTAKFENNSMLTATLSLPAELLVHTNELTFEFIGHYTLQCEDPSHSTLWAHVDSNSQIELAGSLLPLQNDLKLLPLPFYDEAVNLHPSIPVVFLGAPSPKSMQAAGIVTSWFGILTDYHAARFPVVFGTIPQGNAIVISENSNGLPAGLSVSGSAGPTVAVRANPNDPYSKVLLLTGSDADDLLMAAKGLALEFGQLAGETQTVRVKNLKKREPDDAPRWLRTDRRTTIGEISQQGDLQGDGSVPVGVFSRLPPDLYYGPSRQNLAFKMNYRYNGIPLAEESSLQVYQNGAYVSSTPMPHTNKPSAILSTTVAVPVGNMRPFSNTTQMKFIFQIAKKGRCMDTAPMNLQGAVLKDSYLDITDIPHWAALPNLELFANAGYPFTRMADLSETAVVLPDQPNAEEVELYLTLMGHFGAQTGYPVINVTVTDAEGMKQGDRDYLVIGGVDDSPAIAKLSAKLPVGIHSGGSGGLDVQDTEGFFDPSPNAWWKVKSADHVEGGQLETSNGVPDALVEGLEWGKGRSVVLIALHDKSVVNPFLTTFLKDAQSSNISQSVSVFNGLRFASYQVGSNVYHVGTLSLWIQLNLFFSQYPWMIVVAVGAICFLMAALIRAMLRRHARSRLMGQP